MTLRGKLQCLMDTSKHILIGCSPQTRVSYKPAPLVYMYDLINHPNQEQQLMLHMTSLFSGAEEKFPVFVFVVIKAGVIDLHAHTDFLTDFLPQHTITKTGNEDFHYC